MALSDAFRFISDFQRSQELRHELNSPSESGLFEQLVSMGYTMTDAELEDALRVNLLKCQSEEAAEDIREIELWFRLQSI